ncbi:MAG TPA: UvrD-helicase domain-containing protein [bacterium]|nr:UvrD-helicase domain-containing protein [bacterium]
MELLENLNPRQKEAVLHTEGPLLIIAGAGTGKTRVITHKIAHIISLGARPDSILGLTFTNKASDEMKKRVIDLAGISGFRIWLSTFHSFALRILKNEYPKIGRAPFTVFDEDEQLAILKEIIKKLGWEKNIPAPRMILHYIERAKDQLLDPDSFKYHSHAIGDLYREEVSKLYYLYQEELRRNGGMDFGDLLLETVNLFNQNPEILKKYEELFDYILVDEYQDTNFAQYLILKLLGKNKRKVTVVGDEDQSIYSWRGARVENILNFENDWPDCRVIKLEENYRSTHKILECSGNLIRNNRHRRAKELWTKDSGGEPVIYRVFPACRDEARSVCSEILHLIDDENYGAGEIAVFYRTNAQSRILEERMREFNINYRIVGSVSFYERKEIKDLLAYLHLLVNPADDLHLKRVLNVPPRGLGKQTLKKLEDEAGKRNIPILTLLSDSESLDISPKAKKTLTGFWEFMEKVRNAASALSPFQLLEMIVSGSGYADYLESLEGWEARMRMDNVGELLSALKDFEERNQEADLRDFLDSVSLISPYDQYSREGEKVTLMTLHLAKGLEFPGVFITGMEEGILPYRDAVHDPEEMEEERRLCYVGMTRAMKRLYLSSVSSRRLYGISRFSEPSRFLEEAGFEITQVY